MFDPYLAKSLRYILSAILLTGNSLPLLPSDFQDTDTVFSRKEFSAEELVRGERLFYGLAYPGELAVDCEKCHNTKWSDSLNWNPDALEISVKYLNKSGADLQAVLLKPKGKKMAEVHNSFQLTNEDVVLIKAYMDRFVDIGIKKQKPVVTNLLLLIISFVVFSISLTDLIIKRIFRNSRFNLLLLTVSSIVMIWILAASAIAFGRSRNYSPDQPVKFSHYVHAGQNKTDCNYCHYSARSAKSAGIPAGNICLNCHFLVRSGTRSGVTEISKVTEAFNNNEPVKWIRIYRLPDFVFFSHAQHVTAGEIACESCHGDVRTMDRLYQVPDLSMGWCLKCHDTRKVNLTNTYYKTYFSGFYNDFTAGRRDSVMAAVTGGRNCGNCHY